MKKRLLSFFIALDQFLFSILTLGGSYPDETISACAWRMEQQGRLQGRIFRPLIDRLFWFDPHHCANSSLSEKLRLHSPMEPD
jgi:hypothetical protein